MTFSEVLNSYKSNLGLTQSALADLCGTSPAVISRYLNGKRLPEKNSQIIKDIAKGIFEKSQENPDFSLSLNDIERELNDTLQSEDNETDFYARLDALLKDKEVSNTELAKVLPYDSSYISRVRNKKRIPKDQNEFLSLLEAYLEKTPETSAKKEPKSVSKKETAPAKPAASTSTTSVAPAETTKPVESPEPTAPSKPTHQPENSTKKPRQTRFEYFLSKVSTYLDKIPKL